DDARKVWQNGDSAFMRNWPYAIVLGNDTTQSKIAGKFDIHSMLYGGSNTTGHSTTGGWNLAINAFTPNTNAAWSFMSYMLGPVAQKEAAIGASWTPTLNSVYSDPDVLKAIPYFAKLAPILQNALPRPVSPQYPDLSAAIQLRIHQALLKQSSVSDALSGLASDLKTLVNR
ncbi:MAG: extracellular solute-binding protein, partial [Ktedonobacteraceae bacterium]